MRDHTKLRAFELADQLAIAAYELTHTFPKDEQFGLTSQIRRAAEIADETCRVLGGLIRSLRKA
jgi:23S rRNA-intervening sequence protein